MNECAFSNARHAVWNGDRSQIITIKECSASNARHLAIKSNDTHVSIRIIYIALECGTKDIGNMRVDFLAVRRTVPDFVVLLLLAFKETQVAVA